MKWPEGFRNKFVMRAIWQDAVSTGTSNLFCIIRSRYHGQSSLFLDNTSFISSESQKLEEEFQVYKMNEQTEASN